MPVIRHTPRNRTKSSSMYLRNYSYNITSQFGEDGIIAKIFEIITPANKWCVEFGAWDGRHLSNTWSLINQHNWSGILIEGDKSKSDRLTSEHQNDAGRVFVQNAYVGWEGELSLDNLLRKTPAPIDIDLMSIDIDGNDWHVWQALRAYRPRVIVIEHNPTASNEMYFVQDADSSLNQGCSLLALVELGKEKGYELVATTATNGIFVGADLFPIFNINDNSLEAMHPEILRTEICHGYDGTVFAAGFMMLNWHQLPLSQEDFQILPKHLRKYADPV